MEFLYSIFPTIQHFGTLGYWIVFLFAFLESLAFIGAFIPGTLVIALAGFSSTQGYLDVSDLLWFAAIGAIIGDNVSYYLGTRGKSFFRDENKFLKLSHIEQGEKFFEKHGDKSVFLGRFLGPIRPIVPFIAGLSKMNLKVFLLWNVISAFLWAAVYVFIGYFFGGAIKTIEVWLSRTTILILVLFVVLGAYWFIKKRKNLVEYL